MMAKKTANRNCLIPNEGGFRPAGSVVFDELAILDSYHLGQFWRDPRMDHSIAESLDPV